jgi:hypothetical protein
MSGMSRRSRVLVRGSWRQCRTGSKRSEDFPSHAQYLSRRAASGRIAVSPPRFLCGATQSSHKSQFSQCFIIRGVRRLGPAASFMSSLSHEMPRACPVECSRWLLLPLDLYATRCHGLAPWRFLRCRQLVTSKKKSNVTLHGTSPWHHEEATLCQRSGHRETPPGKPVASCRALAQSCSK